MKPKLVKDTAPAAPGDDRGALGATGNLLLDHLDEPVRAALQPYLENVTVRHGEVVYEAQSAFDRVLFPIGSVVSVVTEMVDGSSVEVGFIGREGFTGLPIALGSSAVPHRALVQVPDGALSISAADFRTCLDELPELRRHIYRYAEMSLIALSQYAGCNRLHPINERCARWLLMAHDRVPGDTIFLTHDFLSQMLGVRRPGVSLAAMTLQRAGFIEYTNGRIVVRNRAGLETASCECYAVVEGHAVQTLGYSPRKVA